ncbi:MAG: hypothetical protein ACE5EV_06790, partial [Gaiellales bacterium]
RRFGFALIASLVAAVVTGVPTDLINTPLIGRPIAITVWSYPLWIITSLLIGLLVAASVGRDASTKPLAGGGLLTVFAMGCPVCNKPIVLLLGASGALKIWAPLQPVLGAIAVLLLLAALIVRLRGEVHCSVRAQPAVGVAPQ